LTNREHGKTHLKKYVGAKFENQVEDPQRDLVGVSEWRRREEEKRREMMVVVKREGEPGGTRREEGA
jgi:hypothetical protein